MVFPADGRHLCVPDLSRCEGLFVKGEMFNLGTLLDDKYLADQYAQGSLLAFAIVSGPTTTASTFRLQEFQVRPD